MALFDKSSNPTLRDGIFTKLEKARYSSETMTIKGSVSKTLMLLFLTIFAASYTWSLTETTGGVGGWMFGGMIAGLVLALIISFAPKTAPYLAPVYAVAEGFFLGVISSFFETAFADKFPGIVLTAISITLLTTLVMLFCYQTRLIRVTEKFRSVLIIATISVFAFYMVSIVLHLFGIGTFYHTSDPLSIAVSVVITIIAALNLLLDFDFIEKGSKNGLPKYMEWYGAFALMVTLVWLYLEILRLLSKIANR